MKNIKICSLILFLLVSSVYSTAQQCGGTGGDNKGCIGCGGSDSARQPGGIPIFIPTLHATDPNEILGPFGITDRKWMAGKDQFGYTVRYENDPEFANGPAQKVLVSVPVDPKFDINSVRIGNFGFGNLFFTVPPNSPTYYQRLDLRDSLGLYVDVLAGIDIPGNQVIWVFESIDPATGAEPIDPTLGFLPVRDTSINRFNDSIPNKGEGFVTYTIKPKTNVHTGDTVNAQAGIIFDINAPVLTNTTRNTIDALPPVSTLLSPVVSGNTIRLSWSGQDDPNGCGIRDYELYASENGGAYTLYQAGIRDSFINFTGVLGNSYCFFTLATDKVGNREAFKNSCSLTVALNGCTTPATPGPITGPVNACPYINVAATYSITPVAGASTYRWVLPANTILVSASVDSTSIQVKYLNSFSAGIITVQPISTCGNSSTSSLSVSRIPPSIPIASVTAQPTCTINTGTIVVTAPTGADITYSIGGAYQLSGTFTNVSSGIYHITAQNANGCISDTATVTVNPPLSAPATPVASVTVQPTCTTNTGTILVTAPTGADITYSIGGAYQSSGTFTNVSPGTYHVTAQNANGCISDTAIVTVNPPLSAPATPTATVTVQPTCTTNTGTIVVTAPTGADITYSIGGAYQSSGTFTNVAAGTYLVTAQNGAGCISGSTSLTVNPPLGSPATPTAGVTVQPTCITNGGTIVVTAPTGADITYSIGGAYQASGTFTNVAAGTYLVTAKNAAGCISASISLTLDPPVGAPATPTASVTFQPTCTTNTGTIVVTAPAGADITYSIGGAYQSSGTFTNLLSGTYLVTAKNSSGCISGSISLTVNPPVGAPDTPTASVTVQPTCTTNTGTIVVTAPAGADITYSIGGAYQSSGTFTNLLSGTYFVTAKNSSGCISGSISLTVNPPLGAPATPTASVTVQPTCTTNTGTILVTLPTGAGITYSIGGAYQSSGTFTNVAAGTYQVTAKNSSGCVSGSISLTVNPPVGAPATPTASVTAQPTCTTNTGTIVVTAPTGAGISYSIGGAYQSSGTFINVAAGTYLVTAKNSGGCISGSLSLIVNPVPSIPVAPVSITGPVNSCPYIDSSATYSINPVAGASTYRWRLPLNVALVSASNDSTTIRVKYTAAFNVGVITVQAVSSCGNSPLTSLSITKTVPGIPSAITGPADICNYVGQNITYSIVPVTGAASYLWTIPFGATYVSGQGSTNLVIRFPLNFSTGVVTVKSVANCGTSGIRSLTITKNRRPATPGLITGPTDACPLMVSATNPNGILATYTVRKVAFAVSYNWTVPARATLISHPGGAGTSNDTIIKVKFNSNFNAGNISVSANSNCGISGSASSLFIDRKTPAAPGPINGPTNACPLIVSATNPGGTQAVYRIRKVPFAISYSWSVSSRITIIAHPGGAGTANDTALIVKFNSNFNSGNIYVTAKSNCGLSSPQTDLAVSLQAPGTPGSITGPTNACPLMVSPTNINGTIATYTIRKVPIATAYNWSVPSGASITAHPGGGGSANDTIIKVKFNSNFNGGNLTVYAKSNCGLKSDTRQLYISRSAPDMPAQINGPADACPLMVSATNTTGTIATYSINKIATAISYIWSLPSGVILVSHPGGLGTVNDTVIKVKFNNNFGNGNISVAARSNCGLTSPYNSLFIDRKLPGLPVAINGPSNICPFVGTSTQVIYSITSMPLNSVSTNWKVPAGVTIVSGQGTLSIKVIYSNTFVSGSISVQGVNNCSSGNFRDLFLIKNFPGRLGTITTTTTATCPIPTYNYSVANVANATSYFWTVPANAIILSGQGSNTISVQYNGSVSGSSDSVKVRAINNCAVSAWRGIRINLNACAPPFVANRRISTDTLAKPHLIVWESTGEIKAIPNPTYNEFTIITMARQNEAKFIHMEVSDASGKIIEVKDKIVPGQKLTIGRNYLTGMYFARFRLGDRQTVIKLIKL